MEKILGKKQSIKNDDWLDALERIEELVTREELEERIKATIAEITDVTCGKRAAYAWSAGKDSLVLGEICRMSGITDCMMGVCNLEYPAFMKWVDKYKPKELEIINTGQDMEWLSKHPSMLFPQDSATAAKWFSIVQHRAQARYYGEHNLDVILLGRRRADGNYCGRGTNIYTDGKGVTRYSPLAAWSHEEILAFIHYHKVHMPPIYQWKNGYLCGTHPWPARQWMGSEEVGWEDVYEIDPQIVEKAAEWLPGAEEYLKKFKK